MSDFERSGMTYDEPAKRRTPGTWFSDLGDRLARGFNNLDRPALDEDEPEWEEYDESEQPTTVGDWDPRPPSRPGNRRFPTAMHGYDPEAVDAHLAALEHELADLRVHRAAPPSVEAELERVGEETSAILKVAHEQAAEITRRAQIQADRCVSDAASNAVAMTEEAKRKLRHLDSETDAVWAERGRLIEDVRNVATSLFSLAEDAADRFPEEGDRRAPSPPMAAKPAPRPAAAPQVAATSPQTVAGGSSQTIAGASSPPARSTPRPAAAPPQTAAMPRGPVPSSPPRGEDSQDRPAG